MSVMLVLADAAAEIPHPELAVSRFLIFQPFLDLAKRAINRSRGRADLLGNLRG